MCKEYEELFKLWEKNYSAEAEAEYLRAEEEAESYGFDDAIDNIDEVKEVF